MDESCALDAVVNDNWELGGVETNLSQAVSAHASQEQKMALSKTYSRDTLPGRPGQCKISVSVTRTTSAQQTFANPAIPVPAS